MTVVPSVPRRISPILFLRPYPRLICSTIIPFPSCHRTYPDLPTSHRSWVHLPQTRLLAIAIFQALKTTTLRMHDHSTIPDMNGAMEKGVVRRYLFPRIRISLTQNRIPDIKPRSALAIHIQPPFLHSISGSITLGSSRLLEQSNSYISM
ncbi:hypothetical protein M413DRAFT_267360 [Hebeloma cylindrosporum]|uniref:Uncharacterized protein n=1 Tax=Hebeloma cylindrosporum TaxID=76867 RepID=A0A0C3CSE2_HEBCY|nr:hypothetical protein M413DRAFT_267360 [Hebeloma cylindrosporum h7]